MTDPARTDHLDELDAALVRIRRVLQLPTYRRRLLEGLGSDAVPLTTLRVLRAVERAGDDEPTIGSVAELLAIDPSTASRTVEEAVARGLLLRRACDRDRRRQRLRLTDAGSDLLRQATTVRRGLLAEVTAAWDRDDVAALVSGLDRLADDFAGLRSSP